MDKSKKEQSSSQKCMNCEECIKTLGLIIDGEATPEEEAYFTKHIEKCMPCLKQYHLENAVKKVLKNKLERKPVPKGLVEMIRARINQMA
ncbi:MAG: mycothiol system anti-sigma-R factor [Cytophagales bacterium]|nr:mycothiol system anti-sigma-R factor [Cytophagales bacterium]